MRVKTLEKKKEIIDVAIAVFEEFGYDRSSMAMISSRLGGSKATLYNYFESKEELFSAAMEDSMRARTERVYSSLDHSEEDIETTLTNFGNRLLEFITSDDLINIVRTSVSSNASPELGPLLFKIGPEQKWRRVTEYIGTMIEQGVLKKKDPHVMAMHFKGLLESGSFDARLFGVEPYWPHDVTVKNAVDCFLSAYRVTEDTV